jgi:cytochrome c oxidase subunit 2
VALRRAEDADDGGSGPFINLFGSTVKLQDGRTIVVDDAYLRESILFPSEKIVAGYPAIMPTFKGQISEEQLLQLIAYIKSLHTEERSK